jgi:hypothetical protein
VSKIAAAGAAACSATLATKRPRATSSAMARRTITPMTPSPMAITARRRRRASSTPPTRMSSVNQGSQVAAASSAR